MSSDDEPPPTAAPLTKKGVSQSTMEKVPTEQHLVPFKKPTTAEKRKGMMNKFRSQAVTEEKIINHEGEIEKLNEELRVKHAEIQRLTELQKAEVDAPTNFSFHLAFMFASPLVRKVSSNVLSNVMQLDYKNEINDILKTLKHTSNEIRYRVDVATISNFRSVIADAPFALHFTGHGIQNDKQSLGAAYEIYKDKGNILLMEDSNMMAEYLFEKDLKRLVALSNANREFTYNYEVVFVSSCHSEFAGRIFLASGARHVICIEKSQKVLDKASLRFSKVFYETLFVKKYSV